MINVYIGKKHGQLFWCLYDYRRTYSAHINLKKKNDIAFYLNILTDKNQIYRIPTVALK